MKSSAAGVSLVIGGTGMLAGATHWLRSRSSQTILVARRASVFAPEDPSILPMELDWDDDAFEPSLTASVVEAGRITRALIWMHRPEKAFSWFAQHLRDARGVIVLGSRGVRAVVAASEIGLIPVCLGSKSDGNGGRRWFTHEEISGAAIAALEDGRPRLVGMLPA